MIAVSSTTTVGVDRKHDRLLLLQDRKHKMTEENLGKEEPSEAVVGKIKKLADITLKETVRIRRVILGILPYVNITKLIRDANSAKGSYSSTLRLTVSPA